MKRVLFAIVTFVVAGVLAAACGGVGGGSGGDYADQLEQVGEVFVESVESVSTTSGASPEELARQLGVGAEALAAAAADLREITPPAEVAEAHGLLVTGMEQLAGDFAELQLTVEKAVDDPSVMLDALIALGDLEGLATIDQAMAAFAEAGYAA